MHRIAIATIAAFLAGCLFAGITITGTPTPGGWTYDYDAAKVRADKDNIPCVFVLDMAPKNQESAFHDRVFVTDEFQKVITDCGYIGIYVKTDYETWIYQRKGSITNWFGSGSLPRMTCYWKENKEGKRVDPLASYSNCLSMDVNYYKSYIKSHLGEYDKDEGTKQPEERKWNYIVTTVGGSSIRITYSPAIREGDSTNIRFERISAHTSQITMHVLTNGLWAADVAWKEGDRSTKTVTLKTSITPKYDDGRTLSITVKSLLGN